MQGASDGRTYVHSPHVGGYERFGTGAHAAYESFSAGGEEFDWFATEQPKPTPYPKAWGGSSPSPLWDSDNLAGPLGWTRAPLTNPPEYDSSTAIKDGWQSTLVQDSDNFLLANPDDVTFQGFQDTFFR